MKAKTRNTDNVLLNQPKAQRVFTDREEPRKAFADLYARAVRERESGNCYVLSYYGRGGIGKTSLLRVLEETARKDGAYAVSYDMHWGREQRRILAMIRNALMRDYPKSFSFDSFDLALLQYSQLTGIHNEAIEREDRTIIESNPYLSAALAGISHLPTISIVPTVIETLNKGYHYIKDIGDHRRQAILKRALQIEKMTISELQDLLPALFSKDLGESCKRLDKPLVVFLDTYELLVNYMSDIGSPSQEDNWLRSEVIPYVPNSIWVIAGRDRPRWRELDQAWKDDADFEDHLLGHLGEADTLYFLERAGITDAGLRNKLYDLTDGDPLYLDFSVSIWENLLSKGKAPGIEDFDMHEKMVSRYLRDMDSAHKSMAELLACLQSWNDASVRDHIQDLLPGSSIRDYETLCMSTLVQDDGDGHYHMHEVVSKALVSGMTDNQFKSYMDRIAEFSKNRQYSMDYSAELEMDTSRLIETLNKGLEPSCESLDKGIHELEIRGNYKEVSRILDPLYSYEETVGFRDTYIPVYNLLRSYLFALSYTNHTPDFLSKTEKLYHAYQSKPIYVSISESVNRLLMDAYNNTRNYDRLQEHAERILANLRESGENDSYYNYSLGSLATAYEGKHMYEQAIPLLEEILVRNESELKKGAISDIAFTNPLLHLANAYRSTGRYDKARTLDERAYRICLAARGKEHPDTLKFMNNLALDLNDLKQPSDAEQLLNEVVRICEAHDLTESSNYISALNSLGIIYSDRKDYQKALGTDRKVYELKKKLYAPGHPDHADVYSSLHNLAADYDYIGDKDTAKRLNEEALAGMHETLGMYHPDSFRTLWSLSKVYDHEGDYAKGEAVCREAMEIFDRNPMMAPVNAPYADQIIEWLSYYCRKQNNETKAESAARKWIRLLEDHLPEKHTRKMNAWYNLFSSLYRQKRYSEAYEVSQEALRYAGEHDETSPERCKTTVNLQEWSIKCQNKMGSK